MIPIELTKPIKKPISFLREGNRERIHYHDPSNIIKFEGRYFVWFTRNVEDHKNASTYYAVSHDGTRWDLCGEALGLGKRGQWDDSGNLAPYVAYETKHSTSFIRVLLGGSEHPSSWISKSRKTLGALGKVWGQPRFISWI